MKPTTTTMKIQPIFIEAMIVGEFCDTKFAQLRYNYENLKSKPSGIHLKRSSFESFSSEKKGIHLHWSLPRSYTEGKQMEEQGEVQYPNLPNRWMVTRIALYHMNEKSNDHITQTSWIIESDALRKKLREILGDPYKNSTIQVNDSSMPYRYLGEVRLFDGCTTSSIPHYENLTAMSSGLPHFCAYYPESRDVLGFYDDMKNVVYTKTTMKDVTITYSVCGWYEKTQEDEVSIMLHGILSDIPWYSLSYNYESGVPRTNPMKIAIANSSNEALAAILSQHHPTQDLQEDMLHSLLQGTLKEWGILDGKVNALRKLHQSGFAQESCKKKWYIKGAYTTLNHERLKQVNTYIDEEEVLEEKIHEIKESIYLSWRELQATSIKKEDFDQKLKAYKQEIDCIEQRLKEIQDTEKQVLEVISKDLSEEASLKQGGGERYYRANEPVIVMEGAMQKNIYKKLSEYEDEYPVIRKLSNVQDDLYIPMKDAQQDIFHLQSFERLKDVENKNPVALPEVVESLLKETVLQSDSCVRYFITKKIQMKELYENEHRMNHYAFLFHSYVKEHVFCADCACNPIECTTYEPPWNPLSMEWKATFSPDIALTKDTFTTESWTFDGTRYHKKQEFNEANSTLFKGLSILSPHTSQTLSEQFCAYDEEEYYNLKIKLDSMHTLSQVMGGFNDRMVMRSRETIVLPWMVQEEDTTNQNVLSLIKGEHIYRNKEEKESDFAFYPVRSGSLTLTSLRVIDTFGRFMEYDVKNIILPKALRDDTKPSSKIVLPPRILQPTRLSFHWEELQHTTSSIYGWLWANMNESCLHIYTQEGILVGSIQLVYRSAKQKDMRITLQNPPGETRELCEILQDCNEYLSQFILDLLAACERNPLVLYDLLNTINDSMWDIHASGMHNNLDIFAYLGHPIALCGASLAFECKGPLKKNGLYDKNKSVIEDAKFPVRIGDTTKQNDGTIGFYIHKDSLRYQKLHSCHKISQANAYMDSDTIVSIGINKQPVRVSILMSPYGKVSLTSDIVPVKEAVLHAKMVEDALQHIYLSLYYGPFLTSTDDISLYLPKEMEKEWKYLEYTDIDHKILHRNILNPTLTSQEDKEIMIKEGWLLLYEYDRRKKEEANG